MKGTGCTPAPFASSSIPSLAQNTPTLRPLGWGGGGRADA
ncbi:hypothetical protein EYF80_058813 [Liparis tanakae]|uniref:Uncharacterized protein n=1 Tax=Liparis tanakae TaxID=230148 RepID=A0A4Z2EQF4_9TELE|nr:hypothetical protein EYF80_058813 [Liparis tanakae]